MTENILSQQFDPVIALTVAFLLSPKIRDSSPKISPEDIVLNEPEIIKKAELR